MDWDKLKIFHTVAEASSFTKASTILNLGVSALDAVVVACAILENVLGFFSSIGSVFYTLFYVMINIVQDIEQQHGCGQVPIPV